MELVSQFEWAYPGFAYNGNIYAVNAPPDIYFLADFHEPGKEDQPHLIMFYRDYDPGNVKGTWLQVKDYPLLTNEHVSQEFVDALGAAIEKKGFDQIRNEAPRY